MCPLTPFSYPSRSNVKNNNTSLTDRLTRIVSTNTIQHLLDTVYAIVFVDFADFVKDVSRQRLNRDEKKIIHLYKKTQDNQYWPHSIYLLSLSLSLSLIYFLMLHIEAPSQKSISTIKSSYFLQHHIRKFRPTLYCNQLYIISTTTKHITI